MRKRESDGLWIQIRGYKVFQWENHLKKINKSISLKSYGNQKFEKENLKFDKLKYKLKEQSINANTLKCVSHLYTVRL